MVHQYYIEYVLINIMCLLISIIIASRVNSDVGNDLEVYWYHFIISMVILFIMTDVTSFILKHQVIHLINGFIFKYIRCIISVIIAYGWFRFTLVKVNRKLAETTIIKYTSFIPVIITAIIVCCTDDIYKLTTDNHVIHGDYYRLQWVIPGMYFLMIVITVIEAARKTKSLTKKKEYYSLLLIGLGPSLGAIVSFFMDSLPVVVPATLASMLMIFMNLQDGRIHTDVLTSLYNRRATDEYLIERLAKAKMKPFIIYMIDVDNFKNINDTLGHKNGDLVLQIVAEAMRFTTKHYDGFIARWGGDEFIIVLDEEKVDQAENIINLMNYFFKYYLFQHHLSEDFSLSIGYKKCQQELKLAELYHQVDQEMYQQKEAKK